MRPDPRPADLWKLLAGVLVMTLVLAAMAGGKAEWLEAISVFATICVTGSAAIIGLSLWRNEALGRRRAEVAEFVFETAYQAASVLRAARARSTRGLVLPGDDLPDYEVRLRYLVQATPTFAPFGAARFKGQLFLDASLDRPFAEFEGIRARLLTSLTILVAAAKAPPEDFQHILLSSCRSDVVGQDGDELDAKISAALSAVEEICGVHVKFRDPAG